MINASNKRASIIMIHDFPEPVGVLAIINFDLLAASTDMTKLWNLLCKYYLNSFLEAFSENAIPSNREYDACGT